MILYIVKSFNTEEDAKSYLAGVDPSLNPQSSSYSPKFYGVRNGKVPGVYTSWAEAKQQVVGTSRPKVRAFGTREEAEAFVNSVADLPKSKDATPSTEAGTLKGKKSPQQVAGRKRKSMADDPETTTSKFTCVNEGDSPPSGKRSDMQVEKLLISNSETEALLRSPTAVKKTVVAYDETPSHAGHSRTSSGASTRPGLSDLLDDTSTLKTGSTVAQKKETPLLRIYTDGSALSNGRAGSRAGVGVWFGDADPRYPLLPPQHHSYPDPTEDESTEPSSPSSNVSEPLEGPRQTNNRAELTAILRALEIAPKHREVLIYSDSKYSIQCLTEWHQGWARNGWKTASGKAVENKDLLEQILELIRERLEVGIKTGFQWVKAHTGSGDGNEKADQLAVEGARKHLD